MSLLYVLLAIVVLGVLIAVHEFGHFAAARLCGIPVKEFSIGFGPKLWQRKGKKHDTLFTLRPIPLGGYCMFYGDTDDDPDGQTKDDPRNYSNAPVWKRMASVVSGPLMNLLLAFVVAVVMMACYGLTLASPLVSSVEEGKPAQVAGLMPGDVFQSVGGQDVSGGTVTDVSAAIGSLGAGQPIELRVLREGEVVTLTIEPEYSEADGRWMIGVMIQQGYERLPAGQVVPAAWDACVNASTAILQALGKLFTTGEGFEETAGPVGVVQMMAEQTRQGGLEIFLYLVVIISINLGLVNLLPIPGLDGSRLVFMLIEAVRHKPVKQKTEAMIHLGGYMLLFGLMIVFTYRDILRIFQ